MKKLNKIDLENVQGGYFDEGKNNFTFGGNTVTFGVDKDGSCGQEVTKIIFLIHEGTESEIKLFVEAFVGLGYLSDTRYGLGISDCSEIQIRDHQNTTYLYQNSGTKWTWTKKTTTN